MKTNIDIQGLLEKPIWQMTGEEYCQLTHYALSLTPSAGSSLAPTGQKALGVHALAIELGCSESTIYALMRTPREEDFQRMTPARAAAILQEVTMTVDELKPILERVKEIK